MIFNIRRFKLPEFQSLYEQFRQENNVNMAGEIMSIDYDSENATITIQDTMLKDFTEIQIKELQDVK